MQIYINLYAGIFNITKKINTYFNHINLLTKQEKKIFYFLVKGNNNKEIAENLFISYHTIKTHRKNIFKKLQCSNLRDLAEYESIIEYINH
ncbi:response regulator transcription factor [Siphonobacter sp. SORGH_AS_0500]|uniref:response regulator transcription factor n=1 Tax=Siphonobacter sp. SORGH_AS_0500 TaxID=1864824 RepID=UPI0038F769B7